jgi:hypothetical protein
MLDIDHDMYRFSETKIIVTNFQSMLWVWSDTTIGREQPSLRIPWTTQDVQEIQVWFPREHACISGITAVLLVFSPRTPRPDYCWKVKAKQTVRRAYGPLLLLL